MGYEWGVREAPMVCPWFACGVFVGRPWSAMDCSWRIRVSVAGCPWVAPGFVGGFADGVSVACLWVACGVYVDHPWVARVLSVSRP